MIRKLKNLIASKERELKSCDPKERATIRGKLIRLRVALLIAKQGRVAA